MLVTDHCGLYFTRQHIKEAHKNRKRPPTQDAWAQLHAREKPDLLASTLWNGFRYRLEDDTSAGEKAAHNLNTDAFLTPLNAHAQLIFVLQQAVAFAQCIELVRDHPALDLNAALDTLATRINALNALETLTYTAQVWRGLLNLAGGVVLEATEPFEAGVNLYRQVIEHDIHPDGYIPQIVDKPDGFAESVLTAQALILMAEAAGHAGVDLWRYNNRGVSVITAALYPLYYYFYPEKWQWGGQLTAQDSQGMFQRHGTFLELLNRHNNRSTHAIDLILAEIRPMSDLYGGGLVTLTHAAPKRGLFG